MLPAGQALEVAEGLWAARNIYILLHCFIKRSHLLLADRITVFYQFSVSQ